MDSLAVDANVDTILAAVVEEEPVPGLPPDGVPGSIANVEGAPEEALEGALEEAPGGEQADVRETTVVLPPGREPKEEEEEYEFTDAQVTNFSHAACSR